MTMAVTGQEAWHSPPGLLGQVEGRQISRQPLGRDERTSNAYNNVHRSVARVPSDEMNTSKDVQVNESHTLPACASPANKQTEGVF